MAHMIQFDDSRNGHPLCIACEEMLTDAVDQTLSPADQAWFDRHIASCVECSERFADAQRGAAWLELLKSPRPEPSASLMERILAQTSEARPDTLLNPAIVGQPTILPVPVRANVLAFPRMLKFAAPFYRDWMNPAQQPRLYMTAAMAFFSIALTLNLTGVRLDQLKASNLNPSNVRKSYYEASADAVRYYDNLRVVHVMESRVDDLRTTEDDRPQAKPGSAPAKLPESQQDQKPAAPKDPNGPSSRNESPAPRPRFVTSSALLTPGSPASDTPCLRARVYPCHQAPHSNPALAAGVRFSNNGPTYLGRLNTPTRPIQISHRTKEGGLA